MARIVLRILAAVGRRQAGEEQGGSFISRGEPGITTPTLPHEATKILSVDAYVHGSLVN